jgi:hypothetical protein
VAHIRKLADLVADIPKKPPAPSVRTRGEARKSGRHALELLAASPDGCTESMLLAQGFNHDTLATLVRAGFATVHTERVRAGAEWTEVRRMQISDAGRRVIGRR